MHLSNKKQYKTDAGEEETVDPSNKRSWIVTNEADKNPAIDGTAHKQVVGDREMKTWTIISLFVSFSLNIPGFSCNTTDQPNDDCANMAK